MRKNIEVIIIDDHALFARSLAGLVETFPSYKIRETFNNGAELVDYLSSGNPMPDLFLLDVKMPIMDGISTMKWLKKYHPSAKVIALSMEDDEMTVLSMLRNGAKGYLLKDIQPDELENALDTVYKQGYYHTEMVTNVLMHSLDKPISIALTLELKENEITFIKLACEEKTYKEIADIMNLSPKTIDGYRQQLFDKLNIKNRIGLVIFALKNKLIEI